MLIINSAIGLFYYLRVVVALFREPDSDEHSVTTMKVSFADNVTLAVLTILLIGIGVYPATLIELIKATIGISL
jgi:NADH-quinone oxidoreductase subunit N